MKKNMGLADRILRIVAAAIFSALYFTQAVTGTVGIILLVLGGVFLVTAFIGFCPLYTLFGFNTCKFDKEAEEE